MSTNHNSNYSYGHLVVFLVMILLAPFVQAGSCPPAELSAQIDDSQTIMMNYVKSVDTEEAYSILHERVHTADVRSVGIPARCGSKGIYSDVHRMHETFSLRYAEQQMEQLTGMRNPVYAQVAETWVYSGAFEKAGDTIDKLMANDSMKADEASKIRDVVMRRIEELDSIGKQHYFVREENSELAYWRRYANQMSSSIARLKEKSDTDKGRARASMMPKMPAADSMGGPGFEYLKQNNPEAYSKLIEKMEQMRHMQQQ